MPDRDDAVARFEQPAPRRRAAGHEFVNFAIAVFRPQRRADAEQGQVHGDREIVHLRVSQVVRVRIINVRQRVEIHFKHFLGSEFSHGLQQAECSDA